MIRDKRVILDILIYAGAGLLLLSWLVYTPPGLLGKADAIGYAVCHRIDLRSFHLGDRPLPLCARCTGMHLGALLGLGYQAVFSRRRTGLPPLWISIVLGLFAVGFAFDGLNSFASLIPGLPTLYTPTNSLRLFTGTGMGLGIAAMLFPAFNQTAWRDWQPGPALGNSRLLGGLLVLALVLDWMILSENPLVLYPLALLSAAGALLELTMVYSMIVMMVLRIENRFLRPIQMLLPLAGGFGMGLLQIAGLDLIRYWLTGTWDGFHLG